MVLSEIKDGKREFSQIDTGIKMTGVPFLSLRLL